MEEAEGLEEEAGSDWVMCVEEEDAAAKAEEGGRSDRGARE